MLKKAFPKSLRKAFISGTSAAAVVVSASLPVNVLANTGVTWDDLKNDHKTTEDVLMYGLGLKAQRHSSLSKINTENVAQLKPKWSFSFGDEKQRGQEAQSLIHDGVIYVTASYSRMFALDAKTGKKLWQYTARLPEDIRPCCDVVNRGPAIYGDMVYMGLLDASVVALNKKTGEVVWKEKFGDHTAGYTMTGAPFIIKDQKTGKVMLIHGSSGDEFGVVGRLFARDPQTGKEIWMRPFVEGHMGRLDGKDSTTTGDAKAQTWPDGDYNGTGKVEAWSHGGGAPWQTASFDIETNTIVIGTGNPAPWNTWKRTGPDKDPRNWDSLYTSGQAYVDPSNGELVGFFQHTPNDAWDFSGNNEIVLFEYKDPKTGKMVKAGAHADRNGFFFVTDRSKLAERGAKEANKPTSLLAAYPFVPDISWAKGFDLKTGRPIINFDQYPPEPEPGEKQGKKIQVTPNFLGGKNWNPMSYHPDTGLFYIPSNHWTEDYWTENITYKKGAAYLGQGFRIHKQFDDHIGSLKAMDPVTGDVIWEHREPLPLWAGTLTTKGGLVITGTSDGFVKAFDAKNGKELWAFQTGSGVVSVPVTWEMDGKQYIGLSSGYGGAVPLWGGDIADLTKPVSQGGSYWVFELPEADSVAAN